MHRFVLAGPCAMRTLQLVDLVGQRTHLNSAQMQRDHPDWLTALRDDSRGTVLAVEDVIGRDYLAAAVPDPRLLVRRER
ncbi:hypothetical protein AB0B83_12730 [Micromonospora sp. NPDC049060]|uniref:hypothetical protein n=1 Tax=Micromonospora sp. NPDC049060 TaxID=3154828 RepID=UPI003401BD33